MQTPRGDERDTQSNRHTEQVKVNYWSKDENIKQTYYKKKREIDKK